jgi:putative addiction module component (TIGR02574 family)
MIDMQQLACASAGYRGYGGRGDSNVRVAKPVPLPPPGFDDLSVDEKLDSLQSLWDRIAATPETIPVPDWYKEIIDERLKDLEANPNADERISLFRVS